MTIAASYRLEHRGGLLFCSCSHEIKLQKVRDHGRRDICLKAACKQRPYGQGVGSPAFGCSWAKAYHMRMQCDNRVYGCGKGIGFLRRGYSAFVYFYRIGACFAMIARRYFHPGCHKSEPCASTYPETKLPYTERLCERVLALPGGSGIDNMEQVAEIARIIKGKNPSRLYHSAL